MISKDLDMGTLYKKYDCHRKTLNEVRDELENWILLNQYDTPLEILTGNSEGMKDIVREICKGMWIEVREGWINKGTMIIDSI